MARFFLADLCSHKIANFVGKSCEAIIRHDSWDFTFDKAHQEMHCNASTATKF